MSFRAQTVRYRMLDTPGFEDLRTNFFLHLEEGFSIIKRVLEDTKPPGSTAGDVTAFVNSSFGEPDQQTEGGEWERWRRRVAAYKVLLSVAGFRPPDDHRVTFAASQAVRAAVAAAAPSDSNAGLDPSNGLSLQQARAWFTAARRANMENPLPGGTEPWLDPPTSALVNMAVRLNANNTPIIGAGVLGGVIPYHSHRRVQDVADEIYGHLTSGRIVILDLSVGDASTRERVSQRIAQQIFSRSMGEFIEGRNPTNIVVYVEEAHNLIGRGQALTETWPRLAKEGAKYRIALVYATQEVSSIHPNILANTENWFITHLNNVREIHELSQFYDFDDFKSSLLRAQDVGFARVKTLSSPYVIPTQIDRFDPALMADDVARQ